MQLMQEAGVEPVTNEAALSHAWRDPARQVPMGLLLKAVTVHPLGDSTIIGMRCARHGTSDVVDASLAVLADQLHLTVLTTDPDDMAKLNVDHQRL